MNFAILALGLYYGRVRMEDGLNVGTVLTVSTYISDVLFDPAKPLEHSRFSTSSAS